MLIFYIFSLIRSHTVSSIWGASPQILATSKLLQLPPIESFKQCVSLVCLNGMKSLLRSASAITVCSKNVNDLLMYIASC